MALTKAKVKEILSKIGVESENMNAAVEEIMNGHIASIDALREERDNFKVDAEKLPAIQKDLDNLKKVNLNNKNYEQKYNSLKKEYDDYKNDQLTKKEKAAKNKAYRSILKSVGIPDKRLDTIMKVTDLSNIKLSSDGTIDDLENVKNSIVDEWSDFIVTYAKQGANTSTPLQSTTNESSDSKSRAASIEEKYHSDLYGTN